MSIKKRTKKEFSFGKFGGVDHFGDHGRSDCAESIVNFRLLADGSLSRREGVRPFATLNGNIRAVNGSMVGGVYTLLVLAGNTVSQVNTEDGTVSSIGAVGTTQGSACFFYLKDELYLADGSAIYRYDGSSFVAASGYVPTIGINWSCGEVGKILEPRNILNRRGRITYLVNDSFMPYMCAGDSIEGVEAVYVNGVLRSSSDYTVDTGFNAVVIPTVREGDTVDVRFIFKDTYESLRNRMFCSTSAALFGDANGIRIFLLGGGESGKVFQSRQVSEGQLFESRQIYPESDPLYFPAGSEFDVCNGTNSATAMLRYGDKILVFTEGDVWMVSSEGDEGAQATGVNSHIGCPVTRGAALSENDPFSIGRHSIWQWSRVSISDKSCKATNISAPIDSELGESKLKNCGIFYNPSANELWVYSKRENVAWIYGIDAKAWYSFVGFKGEEFFDLNGKVAFYRGNRIFVFDEDLIRDTDEYGVKSDIVATYVSGVADPMDEKIRTLSEIVLRADLCSQPVELEFIPHGCAAQTYVLNDNSNAEHSLIQKRVNSGRFKYGKFKITASPNAKQHIHGLTVTAR